MGTNVSNKLILEVSEALENSLESGFGDTTILSTDYVDSITNDGITIPCSSSPDDDSVYSSEGQTVNNAFYPPICISSSLDITLTESAFNLNSSSSFDLERTYQGLLVMGAEINTDFSLVTLSKFVFEVSSSVLAFINLALAPAKEDSD